MAVALLLFLARLATVSDVRSTREQIVKETSNVSSMQSRAAKIASVSSWPQAPPVGEGSSEARRQGRPGVEFEALGAIVVSSKYSFNDRNSLSSTEFTLENPCSPSFPITSIMDSLNTSLGASSDPKAALMRQVQQEAAINNARQLISVILSLPRVFFFSPCQLKIRS